MSRSFFTLDHRFHCSSSKFRGERFNSMIKKRQKKNNLCQIHKNSTLQKMTADGNDGWQQQKKRRTRVLRRRKKIPIFRQPFLINHGWLQIFLCLLCVTVQEREGPISLQAKLGKMVSMWHRRRRAGASEWRERVFCPISNPITVCFPPSKVENLDSIINETWEVSCSNRTCYQEEDER